jgi:hypothetical protein
MEMGRVEAIGYAPLAPSPGGAALLLPPRKVRLRLLL